MKKDKVLKILKKEKSKLENEYSINMLALFGSYATNKQKKTSDIDLAYELKEGASFGYLEKLKLEKYLKKLLKHDVDLVQLKYMDPIIKFQIEKDMIYV